MPSIDGLDKGCLSCIVGTSQNDVVIQIEDFALEPLKVSELDLLDHVLVRASTISCRCFYGQQVMPVAP